MSIDTKKNKDFTVLFISIRVVFFEIFNVAGWHIGLVKSIVLLLLSSLLDLTPVIRIGVCSRNFCPNSLVRDIGLSRRATNSGLVITVFLKYDNGQEIWRGKNKKFFVHGVKVIYILLRLLKLLFKLLLLILLLRLVGSLLGILLVLLGLLLGLRFLVLMFTLVELIILLGGEKSVISILFELVLINKILFSGVFQILCFSLSLLLFPEFHFLRWCEVLKY